MRVTHMQARLNYKQWLRQKFVLRHQRKSRHARTHTETNKTQVEYVFPGVLQIVHDFLKKYSRRTSKDEGYDGIANGWMLINNNCVNFN